MQPIRLDLRTHAKKEKAELLQRYFRTGKGEYGEGDVFIGVMVPQTRSVAKKHVHLALPEIKKLLHSRIHEERLAALLILVEQYQRGDEKTRKNIYEFYIAHATRVNNWDLVDLTAPKIVGAHLLEKERKILYRLAKSNNLWERRIAIVATASFIDKGEFKDTFNIVELLMSDSHDLIHKACGWMLREVGKKDEKELEKFLKKNHSRMPRTMLRYAIERFSEVKRKKYLLGKIN